MIESSEAYKKLKTQIQDSIDFVLLSCHAIPALKGYIKAVEKGSAGKIPDPDLFGKSVDHERLKAIVPNYRKVLGRFLIMTSFSYFEAYISDVFAEIFEFHGGKDVFLKRAENKRNSSFATTTTDRENFVKRLREKPKKGKQNKYKKLNEKLNHLGHRFPTDIFSAYGIQCLQQKLENIKSYEIPNLVQNVLGLTLEQTDVDNVNRIRDIRNGIAHGRINEVDLRSAIDDNKFLRKLAVKIDSHIVKYFFIVEI